MAVSDQIIVMDHGRIAQAGTPRELYERPRSEFVAGFMGEAMLFDALALPDGTVRLGPLIVRPALARRARQGARLAVRPEAWQVRAPGVGELAGDVQDRLPRQRPRVHLRHRARPDLRRLGRRGQRHEGGRSGQPRPRPARPLGARRLRRSRGRRATCPKRVVRRGRGSSTPSGPRSDTILRHGLSQADKALRLRELHAGPRAFVIANAFDCRLGGASHAARLRRARDLERRRRRRPRQEGRPARRATRRSRTRARSPRRPTCRSRPISRTASAIRPTTSPRRSAAPAPPASSARRSRTTAARRARRSIRSTLAAARVAAAVQAARALPFAGFAITARAENFFRGHARPRRHDRAPEGVRGGRRRRAVRAGAARPRRRSRRLRGGDEAGQLHGRHEGQVVGPRHARGRRRSPRQPGDVALARGDGRRARRRPRKCGDSGTFGYVDRL